MEQETGSSYYSHEKLRAAAEYWDEKDAAGPSLDMARLKALVEEYILASNTCALATGAGDCLRCMPIEYSYHDGCFWMFSEGGKKFIGLSRDPRVCLAIFDKYQGFDKLCGLQISGLARLIEPFSRDYIAHAEYKKIPLSALKRLKSPMHLICIRPTRIDCLFSRFKELGCSPRQTLILE